jgi:hypothetical protein
MWWVFNATLRPLYPREWPGTLCTGDWVSHRAGLDGCGKTRPHRNSIPGPSIPQKVAALTKLSCRHVVCKLKVDLVHAIQGSEEDEISFKLRRLYHRRMCPKHPLNWSLFGPPRVDPKTWEVTKMFGPVGNGAMIPRFWRWSPVATPPSNTVSPRKYLPQNCIVTRETVMAGTTALQCT